VKRDGREVVKRELEAELRIVGRFTVRAPSRDQIQQRRPEQRDAEHRTDELSRQEPEFHIR